MLFKYRKNIDDIINYLKENVKENDIIEIKMGERIIKVQVMAIAEHVLKNDASSLYKPLS